LQTGHTADPSRNDLSSCSRKKALTPNGSGYPEVVIAASPVWHEGDVPEEPVGTICNPPTDLPPCATERGCSIEIARIRDESAPRSNDAHIRALCTRGVPL